MPALCEATNVIKVYEAGGQSAPILSEVSFAVEPGEFVCIMGPSGSGKSSLLHLVSGLDSPTAGSIHLGGRELGHAVRV